MDLYPGFSDDITVNTVWVENHKTTIMYQMKTISLRIGTLSFGEERLGFSHKEVGTYSLRSSFLWNSYSKYYTRKQS